MVCTPHGMISATKEAMDEYRKQHITDILNQLKNTDVKNNVTVSETDIQFTESEEDVE